MMLTGMGSVSCDEVAKLLNIPGMTINPITAPTLYAARVACFGFTDTVQTSKPEYREAPSWCGIPGVEFMSQLFGSNSCVPQSNAEQAAVQRSQLENTCRNAANPAACVEGALIKSQVDVDAATRTESEYTGVPLALMNCEQKAAEESPMLSSLFGPTTMCAWEKSGVSGSALLWGGAALVLFIIVKKSRP